MTEQEMVEFAEKLGARAVSLLSAGNAIQLCLHADIPVLLSGESATGKTAMVRTIAKRNGMELVIVSLASKSATDITGPPMPRSDGTYVNLRDGKIPVMHTPTEGDQMVLALYAEETGTSYAELEKKYAGDVVEMFSEMCKATPKEDPRYERRFHALIRQKEGIRQQNRKVLVFLDELNRGSKDALNSVMPIYAERTVGTHRLGPNVRVMAAINPPTGAYAVSATITSDPAQRRRLVQIGVKFDEASFAEYRRNPYGAEDAIAFPPIDWDRPVTQDLSFHSAVNQFLDNKPEASYDGVASHAGKVYGSPATWEYVSRIFKTLDALNLSMEGAGQYAVKAILAGLVGQHADAVAMAYKDSSALLSAHAMVLNFQDDEMTQEQFRTALDKGAVGTVTSTFSSMLNVIYTLSDEDYDERNIAGNLGTILGLVADADTRLGKALVMGLSEQANKHRTTTTVPVVRAKEVLGMLRTWDKENGSTIQEWQHPGYRKYVEAHGEDNRYARKKFN